MRRRIPPTRELQLRALDGKLVKIGLVLVAAVVALEILGRGPFSLSRLVLTVGVVLIGLLIGRTLGKLIFLKRE